MELCSIISWGSTPIPRKRITPFEPYLFEEIMKRLYDLLALTYFFGLLSLAVFIYPDEFKSLTKLHPYILGFIKVSLLATFGEYLKKRISTGNWQKESFPIFIVRVFVWGLFGVWFSFVFAMFSFGVDVCVTKGLWHSGNYIWIAFSKSLWINLLGGFAWTMMLTHEWLNFCIEGKKLQSLVVFAEQLNKNIWFGMIPKSIIVFWIPAHTITFALPPEWRILMAATLSVVLGFLLTFGASKK
jgi:hypothetical protein